MKALASAHFCADLQTCTEAQQRFILAGASLVWRFLADHEGADRSLLSDAQLRFLVERGALDPTPRNAAVKAVGIVAWTFADPATYPREVTPPAGLAQFTGRLLYLAVVIDRRNEVLGEWRIDVRELGD
jgi:hypothetical protein